MGADYTGHLVNYDDVRPVCTSPHGDGHRTTAAAATHRAGTVTMTCPQRTAAAPFATGPARSKSVAWVRVLEYVVVPPMMGLRYSCFPNLAPQPSHHSF